MIKDIERNGADKGRGQPEALKHEFTGYYSRRIDPANRLVYKVDGDKLNIVQCGTTTRKNNLTEHHRLVNYKRKYL
ncbi:MAG: type II toxin-antitoxin system YoeB family toxin [Spirochaetaceae bacterium]|nr:type II toxin-antitoxin system YoeB family toxin [Spirochaetaceae bacterium]